MNKTVENDPQPATTDPPSTKRTRLEALLSQGAALGTTLLVLAASLEPKIPPYKGE